MKVKGTDEVFGGYNPLAWGANPNSLAWAQKKKNGNVQNSKSQILTNLIKNGESK